MRQAIATLLPVAALSICTAASAGATGVIARLGHVRAAGTASGPGFIRHGRVTLILTLRDARGSVTVSAASAPVPGFMSP